MDVRFRDGSLVKVVLKDKQLELAMPEGKVLIPVADILRIDVGVRLSSEDRKRIDSAIGDLGHADAKRRAAAQAELLALKEKAYSALVEQTKSDDADAVRRAEQVLAKLRTRVPAEILDRCQFDVIHTAQSKITGLLKSETLRVGTAAFGDRDLKVADLRCVQCRYSGDYAANTPVKSAPPSDIGLTPSPSPPPPQDPVVPLLPPPNPIEVPGR